MKADWNHGKMGMLMFCRHRYSSFAYTTKNSLSRLWGEGDQHDGGHEGRVRGLRPTETRGLQDKPSFFLLLLHLTFGILVSAAPVAAQAVTFERDVLPIFTANCLSCHGGTSIYTQAGLDLRTINSVMRGSLNGAVVVKGSPEKSLLYQKVSTRAMPPVAFKLTLTDIQIETIRKWIEAGAPSEKPAEKTDPDEELTRFEKQALPILSAKCVSCHGAGTPMASLDLRTLDSVLKGGITGPVVMEGASDKSMLIRNILSSKMPPPGTNTPVTAAELETLRQWIDKARFTARPQVAAIRETFTPAEAPEVTEKDRQSWAFRKPVAQPVPKVKNQQRVRTPIDAFVLAKLEAKGLNLSAEASSQTLMRRAYMDLIGLPPTPEEMKAYAADTRPGAYERLIDRLLASPQYGERWGRHWLDATGYTDVTGADIFLETIEVHEGMWRYRDYVVRSFNEDKPYDRFVTEQLAGDELVDWRNAKKFTPQILDSLTATGYLRSVYDHTDADIVNLPHERYEVLFHVAEKVSSSLLGLTVGCARCHSHKYDPIPQRDFYRFLSIFAPAYNPWNWTQPKNRVLATVSPSDEEEIKRHNADLDKPIADLQKELATLLKPYQERLLDAKLQTLPAEIRAETKAALDTPADKRDDVQKFLVKKFGDSLKVKPEDVEKALKEADATAKAKIDRQIKTLNELPAPAGEDSGLTGRASEHDAVAATGQRGNARSQGSTRGIDGVKRSREIRPRSPSGHAGENQRLPAGIRALAHQPRSSADCPRHGEPGVAAALRTRHCRDARQLWEAGGCTDASRTAGLVGRRLHATWLDAEAIAPPDHDVQRLPAVVSSAGRRGNLDGQESRSGKPSSLADESAAARSGSHSGFGLGSQRQTRPHRGWASHPAGAATRRAADRFGEGPHPQRQIPSQPVSAGTAQLSDGIPAGLRLSRHPGELHAPHQLSHAAAVAHDAERRVHGGKREISGRTGHGSRRRAQSIEMDRDRLPAGTLAETDGDGNQNLHRESREAERALPQRQHRTEAGGKVRPGNLLPDADGDQ